MSEVSRTPVMITHNPQFEVFKAKYERNFITKETLQGWVKINKKVSARGITEDEYFEITGENYPTE